MMSNRSYIIGIDLGTTNCTMAYTSMQQEDMLHPAIEQVEITQALAAQTHGSSFSLPSFIYYPLSEELQAKVVELPLNKSSSFAIGTYARDRGAELPTRLITSAKSWLCHPGIDR